MIHQFVSSKTPGVLILAGTIAPVDVEEIFYPNNTPMDENALRQVFNSVKDLNSSMRAKIRRVGQNGDANEEHRIFVMERKLRDAKTRAKRRTR